MSDTATHSDQNLPESPQGTRLVCGDEDQLVQAVETAFDYRGDVTLELSDGSQLVGYVSDRQRGRIATESYMCLIPTAGGDAIRIGYDQLRAIGFTGRDTAAGRSWETWVRNYRQRHEEGEMAKRPAEGESP